MLEETKSEIDRGWQGGDLFRFDGEPPRNHQNSDGDQRTGLTE